MKFILIFILSLAFADKPYQPKQFSGSMVEVELYDEASQTYELKDVEFYGQGPFYVTPEELAKGVPAIQLKRILKDPKSVVKNQYKTDREITLLTPDQMDARRKKLAKKK